MRSSGHYQGRRRVTPRLHLTLAIIVVAAVAVRADDSQRADTATLTLDAAVTAALAGNPGLAEIRARAEALAAIPSQVGAPPDPKLSFGALNLPTDTFDLDQEPMTQMQIGVSQTMPFPGKLRLRERIASLNAEAGALEVEELMLDLVADVKSVWWELAYLREVGAIVARNQDLMREFVEIARTKYEVGKGLQQDVLLAQLELSKLLDLAIQIDGRTETAHARLNALLDWPPERRVRLPDDIPTTLPDMMDPSILHETALAERPLIDALEARVDAATTGVDLAKKDYYPDLDVSAAYSFRSGDDPAGGARADFATLRLGVSIPIFAGRKQARAVDQRRAELIARGHSLLDAKARIRREVATAIARFAQARDSAELFRKGIIPQARQTVASMLAAYQVNKVDFLNLVGAEITLYNYEMQYWQAVSIANQALAELAAAAGTENILDE